MNELEKIREKYLMRNDSGWEENDHPRSKDGKFTSGGGAATAVADKPEAPKKSGGSEPDFEAFEKERDPDFFKDQKRKLTYTDKNGIKREYGRSGSAKVYGAEPFKIDEMKKAASRTSPQAKKCFENAEVMNSVLDLCKKNGATDIGVMNVVEYYGTIQFERNGKPCGKVTYDRTMDRITGNYNKEDGSWVDFNTYSLSEKPEWKKQNLPVYKGKSQPSPY